MPRVYSHTFPASMISRTLASLVIAVGLASTLSLHGQPAGGEQAPALVGHIEDKLYVSPTGLFKVEIPVMPELGGNIVDTDNVVTFQDAFNVHASIACFAMDATQRWEHETRGRKEYLIYFFTNIVQADFQQRYPGASIESAKYLPSVQDGSLLTFTLLPGGSMFEEKIILATGEQPPVAKRGNLVFVKNEHVYIVSIELAEKVLDRTTWDKKPAEEDEVLRRRLLDLVGKMSFTPPTPAAPAK
jgi:hypothetical protein